MNLPQPKGPWQVVYTPDGHADGFRVRNGPQFTLLTGDNADCFAAARMLNMAEQSIAALRAIVLHWSPTNAPRVGNANLRDRQGSIEAARDLLLRWDAGSDI